MIDTDDNLNCICWTDIEKGIPVVTKLIDSLVEDFCVTRKGMAIVYTNGDLKLPGSIKVDSKITPADVKWSTVVGASNRWIVAGDNKGHVVLLTLTTKGLMRLSLTIKLTHNGFRPEEYATLYSIKMAVERRHCSLLLAFGNDGCSYLISMKKSGQLILVQSIASILNMNVEYDAENANKTTLSVADTGIEGQFIILAYKQINIICLKFK